MSSLRCELLTCSRMNSRRRTWASLRRSAAKEPGWAPLRSANGWIEAAWLIAVDSVELVSRFASAMLCDVVGEGGCVQPAPAHAKPLAQGFRGRKELVGYRKRDFHTKVLPWYESGGKADLKVRLYERRAA